jgi:hypothetical protein
VDCIKTELTNLFGPHARAIAQNGSVRRYGMF